MIYFKTSILYSFMFIFLEVVFKLFTGQELLNISLVNVILFSICLSLILNFISTYFTDKIQKIIYVIVSILTSVLFLIQFGCYKVFKFYFSFNQTNAAGQIFDFTEGIVAFVESNLIGIIFILMPLFMMPIIIKMINFDKNFLKIKIINIICIFIACLGLMLSVFQEKKEMYSGYNLIFKYNEINLSVNKLGVLNASLIDGIKCLIDFKEDVKLTNVSKPSIKDNVEIPKEYGYNVLDINFDKMNENKNLINLNNHIRDISPSQQNEYTSFFEDKNVIVLLAESFNEIGVDEKRTPTLYKLINNGFVFENYYSPTIASTLGGEYQLLTGLYPASGFIATFKNASNEYPFGLSNMFETIGYDTYAYHNNGFSFQGRDKYLKKMGFDNFKACGNGMEKLIDCDWLQSDGEMISKTMSDYINNDGPFLAYYVTVSGHGEYTANSKFLKKYNDRIVGDFDNQIKSYFASQMELDLALEILIKTLKENNILKDTVIVLAGDHYPYSIDIDKINSVSSVKKDEIVTVNHSNLIIYNEGMESVKINKVASQIDVLPTIYNLFGIKYDSRLFTGHDIFSNEPGLAIFSNRSWVSDYGTYYVNNKQFINSGNIENETDYINQMNMYVSSAINVSSLITSNNYYKYVIQNN